MADKIPTQFERAQSGLGGPEYFGEEQWDRMSKPQRDALILVLAEVLANTGPVGGRPFWKGPQTASRPPEQLPENKNKKRKIWKADNPLDPEEINRPDTY